MEKVLRTFKIEKEIWDKFKLLCNKNDDSVSRSIRLYIKKQLKKNEKI